jgi:hypothetical protein
MTVLAVPATSAPSERDFSSSGHTVTHARNQLTPVLMEALQVLKFNHKNGILDFSSLLTDDFDEIGAFVPDEVTEGELINEYRGAEPSA